MTIRNGELRKVPHTPDGDGTRSPPRGQFVGLGLRRIRSRRTCIRCARACMSGSPAGARRCRAAGSRSRNTRGSSATRTSTPPLLLLHEASIGLLPAFVEQRLRIIEQGRESGVAVLMVEQNGTVARRFVDGRSVLSTREVVVRRWCPDCCTVRPSCAPASWRWPARRPRSPRAPRTEGPRMGC